jgi:epoxyqueuosine reductase
VADGCGSCRRCIDQCPTGAIVEPGVIDAARCLAWVLQKPGVIDPRWRRAIGDRIYGCDDCQEACPPTVRLGGREPAPPVAEGRVERTLDALELLAIDDDAVLARWGRWYVTDRQPRWLRRNALVVVGNSGRGTDARIQHTLVRYLADDDPMLRAHAVWAARELGQHHLLPDADDDPLVAAELNEPC